MTYYLLPRTNMNLFKQLNYLTTDNDINKSPPIFISNSLARYLYAMKENIDNRENEWDIYKKYTNPFEYIHTIIPFRKKCVSKQKPLSRSYFKMLELCQLFNYYLQLSSPSDHLHGLSSSSSSIALQAS